MAANAGRYAYSTDGTEWHYSRVVPYNGSIGYTNGSAVAFGRVERPVLVFDKATGNPTHLINGVQPRPWPHDYTYTLIQTIDQS